MSVSEPEVVDMEQFKNRTTPFGRTWRLSESNLIAMESPTRNRWMRI
jgi:hypothetical protein